MLNSLSSWLISPLWLCEELHVTVFLMAHQGRKKPKSPGSLWSLTKRHLGSCQSLVTHTIDNKLHAIKLYVTDRTCVTIFWVQRGISGSRCYANCSLQMLKQVWHPVARVSMGIAHPFKPWACSLRRLSCSWGHIFLFEVGMTVLWVSNPEERI